jgi:prepilin peptidase CpaA
VFEVPTAVIVVAGALACVFDLRWRRIPNALTFTVAGLALVYRLATGGPTAMGEAALGWLIGAALFLPWFALGGMGAGDVKLVAALAAWLGPVGALWLVVDSAIAGAVVAVAVSLVHGYLRQALRNVVLLLMWWRTAGPRPLPELTLERGTGPRLAYAFPIMLGALATIWLR